MKKIIISTIVLTILCTAFTFMSVGTASADVNYYLFDDFGRAPLVREMDEDMERVELSAVHKPYTKYGYGVKLKKIERRPRVSHLYRFRRKADRSKGDSKSVGFRCKPRLGAFPWGYGRCAKRSP